MAIAPVRRAAWARVARVTLVVRVALVVWVARVARVVRVARVARVARVGTMAVGRGRGAPREGTDVARAIWKGVVGFGDVAVPVKLYAAVEDRKVHFRLLHERDRVPVKQRMVNPATGNVVPYEQMRRGFETDDGAFVVLDEADLAELEPEPSRAIDVTRFVPPSEIDHRWYDRPYFLGPDGDDGAYFALAAALRKEDREGVARWVMRKKEYVGALRTEGDYLMLITLRHAGEVVAASSLPKPKGRAPAKGELAMARQLVGLLEDDFDPTGFHDEYRERVLALIEAKASGRAVPLRRPPEKEAAPESLEDVLRASVEGAKRGRAHAA